MQNNNTNKIIITDENEKEYWEEFKKTLPPQIKEALITKYEHLLEYAADRLKPSIGEGRFKRLDYEDLVCLGYFGLSDAIDRYDPNKDVIKFKTYAVLIIQGAIYDEATRIYYFSRIISRFLNYAEKLSSEERKVLRLFYSEGLTSKEISEKMNISRSEFWKLFMKACEDVNEIYKKLKNDNT